MVRRIVHLFHFLGRILVALAATDGAHEPGWSAGAFPGPVLLEVVFAGFEVAA